MVERTCVLDFNSIGQIVLNFKGLILKYSKSELKNWDFFNEKKLSPWEIKTELFENITIYTRGD